MAAARREGLEWGGEGREVCGREGIREGMEGEERDKDREGGLWQ